MPRLLRFAASPKLKDMTKPPGKPPSASATVMTEMVLPTHTNALGTAFGGTVMAWIDIAAAIAAHRHARQIVVTVSVDALNFEAPVRLGNIVEIRAMVNRAFKTSMEIGVLMESEDKLTGKRVRNVKAYLTFVALDENGRPNPVAQVEPQTPEEKRRYDEAKMRKDARLELAQEIRDLK